MQSTFKSHLSKFKGMLWTRESMAGTCAVVILAVAVNAAVLVDEYDGSAHAAPILQHKASVKADRLDTPLGEGYFADSHRRHGATEESFEQAMLSSAAVREIEAIYRDGEIKVDPSTEERGTNASAEPGRDLGELIVDELGRVVGPGKGLHEEPSVVGSLASPPENDDAAASVRSLTSDEIQFLEENWYLDASVLMQSDDLTDESEKPANVRDHTQFSEADWNFHTGGAFSGDDES